MAGSLLVLGFFCQEVKMIEPWTSRGRELTFDPVQAALPGVEGGRVSPWEDERMGLRAAGSLGTLASPAEGG